MENVGNLICSSFDLSNLFIATEDVSLLSQYLLISFFVTPIICFYSKKFNIISNSPGFLDTIKAKRLSEKNLIEFQMAGFIQHNQTFYEDVFQIEAGSLLESKKKGLIYKSYYSAT